MEKIYDIAIIGGGINGSGCAADASLRGLSVVLCEQDDLASKTSSSSTKLIHGGLRYLENYQFSLVKKALCERQILINVAPHLVHPQVFILPCQKFMRPNILIRMGLFIYDFLSFKNTLPKSQAVSRIKQKSQHYFTVLKKNITQGFRFYDAITDDARLTIMNAVQAKNHGAKILTYTKLLKAEVEQGIWQIYLQTLQEPIFKIQAKAVINAAGPWVNIVSNYLNITHNQAITWVKGSHILVPALYLQHHAYLLQSTDKRVIFVIPYHGYSLIGTTELSFEDSLDRVHIDEQEITYLCDLINQYFTKTIKKEDVVHTWSGIRPLLTDDNVSLKNLSRDYKHFYTTWPAPAVTIYGGKITTYRKLAIEVIDNLCPFLKNNETSQTHNVPLPGAETRDKISYSKYRLVAQKKYSWLEPVLLERYLNTYGTLTEEILLNCLKKENLGIHFGQHLYQVEVLYLLEKEWARTVEDILWRRTKLGLKSSNIDLIRLEAFISAYFS